MAKCSVIYKTPIGPLKLEATDEGICAVKWLFGKHSDSERQPATGAPHAKKVDELEGDGRRAAVRKTRGAKCKADEHLQMCRCWLDAYFSGTLLQSDPPKPPLVLPTTGE